MADTTREPDWRHITRIAWPFILSNSFWMIQISLDRVMLGWSGDAGAVGASMVAAMLFWAPLSLFHFTSSYATTFVAQYTGAGQHQRVGAAVWQALHFSVLAGLLLVTLRPLAAPIVALAGHEPLVQEMEVTYFGVLCFAALPMLVTAAASSFFAGRGASRTVLLINGVGMVVNGLLDYAWIFGRWGFPALGIAGAGWATVVGNTASAVTAVALMLRPAYRREYATLSGWRPDRDLFFRLMRFGLPSGVFAIFDTLGFTLFTLFVGRLGQVALDATTIAFTLNLIVFLPTLGMGQAVSVLVGQHLGEGRPERAEQATWIGLRLALLATCAFSVVYLLFPGPLTSLFGGAGGPAWEQVTRVTPVLLRFIVVYCLFDCMSLIFSSALRGAGDTRFVTVAALTASWPVLVLPTWLACTRGWGLFWAWSFASLYIMILALTFLWRFRQGKWKAMRVIEDAPKGRSPASSLRLEAEEFPGPPGAADARMPGGDGPRTRPAEGPPALAGRPGPEEQ